MARKSEPPSRPGERMQIVSNTGLFISHGEGGLSSPLRLAGGVGCFVLAMGALSLDNPLLLMALKEFHPQPGKSLWRRFATMLLILLGGGVLLASFYGAVRLMPGRTMTVSGLRSLQERAPNEELLTRSRELVEHVDQLEEERSLTPEDIALLGEAVGLREQYIRQSGIVSSDEMHTFHQLRRRWQDLMAEPLREEAEACVKEAEVYEASGNQEETVRWLQKAAVLQRRINEDYPYSSMNSSGRYSRYERRLRSMESEPLYKESLDFERRSQEAALLEDWEEARKLLHEAWEIQRGIIARYPGMPHADMPRLRKLEQMLQEYESLEDYRKVETLIARADIARETGEFEQAGTFYEEARAMQRTLNDAAPDSRFASRERTGALAVLAQTMHSAGAAAPILKGLAALDEALVARDDKAVARLVKEWQPQVVAFVEAYPRSEALPTNVAAKLAFLTLLEAELGKIYHQVKNGLVPIPGYHADLYIEEVPQSLFRMVVGNNPSRQGGAEEPVDSVNITDTQTFCERLGWILGAKVHLPTPEQWRACVELAGEGDGLFKGLLNTYDEWVAGESVFFIATRPTESAQAAGERFSLIRKDPRTRSRDISFRFVVER